MDWKSKTRIAELLNAAGAFLHADEFNTIKLALLRVRFM
jgi:hypothetical protein